MDRFSLLPPRPSDETGVGRFRLMFKKGYFSLGAAQAGAPKSSTSLASTAMSLIS